MFKLFKLFVAMVLIKISLCVQASESHLNNQAPKHVQFLELQNVDLPKYVQNIEKLFIDAEC